jgi:hypothetical protein
MLIGTTTLLIAPAGILDRAFFGSNESGNPMTRRRMPKETDFTEITEEDTLLTSTCSFTNFSTNFIDTGGGIW